MSKRIGHDETAEDARPQAESYWNDDRDADNAAPEEAHLLEHLRVLYKRRWTAVTTFVLVVLAMMLRTLNAIPVYEARVQLLIDVEAPKVLNFKDVFDQGHSPYDYEFTETQQKLLTSRSLARKTLDALRMWQHPYFGGPTPNTTSSSSTRGAIGFTNGILALVRGAFQSKAETIGREKRAPAESAAESQAIDAFLGGLVIIPVKNSRLVDVVYRSPDPVFATTIVNELAHQYIQQNVELRFHASKDASDWLGQQLAEQRKKVEVSELAIQRFREDNDAVSLEDRQNIVVQKLADLNGAVTSAKNERITKEAGYNRLRTMADDRSALDAFPAILSNSFVQQLKSELADAQHKQAQFSETLGDKHPDMIKARSAVDTALAKLNTEIDKVVESVHNEYLTALAREQDLVAALNAQKNEALGQNRKAIAYGALQRDAASNRQMFEALLQRTKETGLSEELRATNVRIVDAAEVPRSPAGPNTRTDFLLAVLVGGVVAVGFVFGLEYLDNRIKSPDEITAHLRMPCLGLVPAAPDNYVTGGAPLINNGVPAYFSEAFRTIRTNVLFSSVEEGSRTIVVTSTGPGEGKTVVSSNLALALAQANQRVLLVDADMRRPQIHSYFSHPQEPGLSNFIVGNSEVGDVVRPSGVPGLWLLPSGLIPPNPAELLGSMKFKEFLATLKERFDWVIIDSPPVMAVTDACILAHSAHGVLFVVGAEMTNRKAARRALKQLALAQAGLMGAVLNRVDVEHHGHYYSGYYRTAYARYYGAPAHN